MEGYQLRVLDEHNELSDRIDRLMTYISSDLFHNASPAEKPLLYEQLKAMIEYHRVLSKRISTFV